MGNEIYRRRVLQGGAASTLGITSFVLPGASAAASPFWWTEGSSGLTAPSYSASDALIAEWTYSNSADDSLGSTSATLPASFTDTNAVSTASLEVGVTAPGVYSTTLPGSDTDSPVGSLYPQDADAQFRFVAAEPSTTVRVPGGPYLQITVSAPGGYNIDPRALVFSSVASAARLSVRSDADGYATSLRDFATPNLEARNVVVNLESLAPFGTRVFRIYPYATGTANGGGPMNRSLFTFRRQFDSGPEAPLIPALDTYDSRQDSKSPDQANYSAVIGLIGAQVFA